MSSDLRRRTAAHIETATFSSWLRYVQFEFAYLPQLSSRFVAMRANFLLVPENREVVPFEITSAIIGIVIRLKVP
jgi:hypothetical protein